MVTKKASARKTSCKSANCKSVKTASSNASPREVIAKYDCLQTHVKILTVLSCLIFVAVVALGVILLNCDDCKTVSAKTVSSSEVEE